MKPRYDFVVVMPIGPKAQHAFVRDTLASLAHYTRARYKVVLADDSQAGLGATLQTENPEWDVVVTKKAMGWLAGLYINLADAYHYALERYDFDAVLKLDDDALITGAEPEREALELFAEQPDVGIAGRLFRGRHCPDEYGNVHDNMYPRNTLLVGALGPKMIRRPRVNWTLRRILMQAVQSGADIGENVFGGAYFISRACLHKLNDSGYLPMRRLGRAILGEDHLFSLLTCAVGMKLADLSTVGQPFACAWRGLPAAPEILHRDRKKIVHSTRFFEDLDEAAVRVAFQQFRDDFEWPGLPSSSLAYPAREEMQAVPRDGISELVVAGVSIKTQSP